MDLYKNVTGDIDAMITFDKILGGFGQNTVNTTRERVQINSKHEKVEPEVPVRTLKAIMSYLSSITIC